MFPCHWERVSKHSDSQSAMVFPYSCFSKTMILFYQKHQNYFRTHKLGSSEDRDMEFYQILLWHFSLDMVFCLFGLVFSADNVANKTWRVQHCTPTSLHGADGSLPLGAQQRRYQTTNSECFHGCRKHNLTVILYVWNAPQSPCIALIIEQINGI